MKKLIFFCAFFVIAAATSYGQDALRKDTKTTVIQTDGLASDVPTRTVQIAPVKQVKIDDRLRLPSESLPAAMGSASSLPTAKKLTLPSESSAATVTRSKDTK